MLLRSLWLALLGLVLVGLALPLPAQAGGKELVVGLSPNQPIRTLLAQHEQLAAHLSASLNRPVKLVSAKDNRVFGQRMLMGNYELALAPAHLARLAQRDHGWHPLVRYESDTAVFLLARKADVDITPADLKNKVLAVPDRTMLVTLAGERWLAQQHLLADSDYTVLVTGGYASSINAVANGFADMALGARDAMAQARPEDVRKLKIVKEIAAIPRLVFIARHDMDAPTRTEMQRALLSYVSATASRLTAVGAEDLSAMDVYLPKTQEQLKIMPPIPALARP